MAMIPTPLLVATVGVSIGPGGIDGRIDDDGTRRAVSDRRRAVGHGRRIVGDRRGAIHDGRTGNVNGWRTIDRSRNDDLGQTGHRDGNPEAETEPAPSPDRSREHGGETEDRQTEQNLSFHRCTIRRGRGGVLQKWTIDSGTGSIGCVNGDEV